MLENICSPAIRLGWFAMPYYLFDRMAELSEAELRLLLCVARYALGWHVSEVPISHGFVSACTGLHQTSIRRALVSLQEKGLLGVTQRKVAGRLLNVFEPVLPEEVRRTLPRRPSQKAAGAPAPERRAAEPESAARVHQAVAPAPEATAPALVVPETRGAEPEREAGVHLADAPARETTAPAEGSAPCATPCATHGDPMHRACHVKNVPSNEGKKKQQHRDPRRTRRGAADGPAVRTEPAPHPAAVPSEHDLSEEQKTLLARMRAVGVGLTTAVRLLRERAPEIVRRALDHLPMRRAKRPAALLVRELQEGGWETPPEIAAEQERQQAEEVRRAREAERAARERQEAEAVEERYRAAWEAFSAERRAEAVAEARRRTSWAAHLPGATDPDGPLLRGMVREVVAEWSGFAVRAEGAPSRTAGPRTGPSEGRGWARPGAAVAVEAA